MIVIILWVGIISFLYFFGLHYFKRLRVSILDEVIGLDIAEMGGLMHINKAVNDKIARAESLRGSQALRVPGAGGSTGRGTERE